MKKTIGFLGGHHTKEARERIRQAHLGKPKSPEHRAKISAALKGNPKLSFRTCYWKGKSLPLEVKEQISQTLRGRKVPKAVRIKISCALKGRSRLSSSSKRAGETLKASPFNEQRKQRIQKAHQELWTDPVYAQRRRVEISLANRGKIISESQRIKLSLASKKLWSDSKYADRMRDSFRKIWSDPEHVRKMFNIWSRRPNKVETRIDQLLTQYWPNDWKYVGDGQCVIGRKLPDFINVNGKKAIIEVFGRYWHKKTDAATRTKHFKRYGFKTLCVWEDVTDEQFIEKVQEKFYIPEQVPTFEKELCV